MLAGNARGRRFYEAAGWRPDGAVAAEETGGVMLDELRYQRRLFDQGTSPALSTWQDAYLIIRHPSVR
ncbi:hypothetical protein [Streptomyces sp. SR27]|uniref:hypothetical protein n=1 Tax=Streptomyces sp. SR27 TaxID=3076630 RepID=UPI00295B66AC|nr:hypothetical protein [Streptomyces sp. SR27]